MRRATGTDRQAGGRGALVSAGPIRYIGHYQVRADLAHLKAAAGAPAEDLFVTAISPKNLEMCFENQHCRTKEAYLVALADAMREVYRIIVDAGFVLQVYDPRLVTHYNRVSDISPEENRRFLTLRADILNHALQGIPEDRERFHTSYSINVAPRVRGLEMKHSADLMLKVRAQAYSIGASNPRHEHEWRIWRDMTLPEHKLLIPGVVSHCVYQVEHLEFVAERMERFAGIVGRDRVIAGTDCGFATSRAGGEVHPDVAWARLQSLVEGARIERERLWRCGAASSVAGTPERTPSVGSPPARHCPPPAPTA